MANALAYVFGGKNFTRWDNTSNQVQAVPINAQSADQAINEIVNAAQAAGGQEITTVISWAGTEHPDGNFDRNNFPIRNNPRAEGSFNFRQELNNALAVRGLKADQVNLVIHNDGDLSLMDCAIQDDLKKNSRAMGILLGSGLSVSKGNKYLGEGKFDQITSADSSLMPDLDKYAPVEGAMRQYSPSGKAGTAAAYITAGRDDEQKLGAKATALHLAQLASDKNKKAELKNTLKLLYGNTGFFKKIWDFISFGSSRRMKAAKESELIKILEQHQAITNEALVQAAQKGDKLSLQILMFTAKRVVDFLEEHLKTAEKGKQPDKLYFYGTFANEIFAIDQVKNHFSKQLRKVTKAKFELKNPEMDGAKDLAQKLS